MKKLIVSLLLGTCTVMMVGCGTQNTNASTSVSESIVMTTESDSAKVPESTETSESAIMSESEEGTNLMIIENVFIINDHGVIITGMLTMGTISTGDIIAVNDENYTVFMIDAVDADTGEPCSVNSAEEGMSVALHLATMDPGKLKQGDIVKLK